MSKATPHAPGDAGIPGADDVPEAVVVPRRGLSIVWLMPIIAALIGAWLWYQAEQEKGPVVTISLRTADDIEAGKTRVRYRNVDLGEVDHVDFSPDLSGVVLTMQMNHRATPMLRKGTRFWVVRPQIGARGISGLGTLVSGAYIELDPAGNGEECTTFVGLEAPPVAPADAPGLKLHLQAEELASLDVGSGVSFRGVQVGQVESHRLAIDDQSVEVDIYIEPAFAPLIRRNSRFWNASGIEASVGADGMQLRMQSLDALVRGGIAFDTPEGAGALAVTGDTFTLHEDRATAQTRELDEGATVVMFFTGSVRGLAIGAPVEYRGIPIGAVKDFWLEHDAKTDVTRIPVVCTLKRGVARRTDKLTATEYLSEIKELVANGLRARLTTGSLLTGSLYIDLALFPEIPPTFMGDTDLYEVPTIPSAGETISNALTEVSAIVTDLHTLIGQVESAAPQVMQNVSDASQALVETLAQAKQTLQHVEEQVDASAELRAPLQETLAELGRTLRSLRQFTDMLERHPEALIQGKP